MSAKGIKVTVEDLETGEKAEETIWNDYILITAGNRFQDSVVTYSNGTHVITVKVEKP